MDRLYSKPNPEISEKGIDEKIITKSRTASSNKIIEKVHSSYIKSDSFRYAKAYIVVFSGGTTREDGYFALISNEKLFPRFKFEFLPEPNFNKGGEPRIFEYAYKKVKVYKSSETTEYPDDYYIISDVDHFYSHLVANKERCELLGIKLIISNPCFEVWLYYSKFSDRFEGCPVPQDDLKFSQTVKNFYNRTGTIQTRSAILDIDNNIKNAKANYQEDDKLIPKRFSTNMYRFAEKILPFISEEISNIKKEREDKMVQYKSQTRN